MARKRRTFSVFSLSFLDIMSCGFGATVLIFLIMDHATEVRSQEINKDLLSEVNFLEKEVLEGERDLAELRNTIALVDESKIEARGRADEIIRELARLREELSTETNDTLSEDEHINQLKSDIRQLEEENRRLQAEGEKQQGNNVRQRLGDGDIQYLTGLKLGGRRILILLDTSASMLDKQLVNIVRLRNMPKTVQQKSKKWQQAIGTVDWLTTQVPKSSQIQIVGFNTTAAPLLETSAGKWLDVADREQLDSAIEVLRDLTPAGGTSLVKAFDAISTLKPAPDNIYLITDGLPTQGASRPAANNASGRDRLKYFNQAIDRLPRGIPVNVILAPMEGDPMAASAFWQLALSTNGAFIAPSEDWP